MRLRCDPQDSPVWRIRLEPGDNLFLAIDYDPSSLAELNPMAEAILAHDWSFAFEQTFHGVFPDAGLPGSAMLIPPEELEARLAALLDPDGAIRSAYGALAGVPVTFLIDGDGLIAARTEGWRTERDPPLTYHIRPSSRLRVSKSSPPASVSTHSRL